MPAAACVPRSWPGQPGQQGEDRLTRSDACDEMDSPGGVRR